MAPIGAPAVNCDSLNRGVLGPGPKGRATLHPTPAQPQPKARFPYRVLAGVIAAFLLLVSLPVAIHEGADRNTREAWFVALCSLYAGVGLAVGARTGYWPFTRVYR